MKINVLDSLDQTLAILDAPESERADLLLSMRQPMSGMFPWIPGGPDHLAAHRGTFGFPLTGHDELLREALTAMRSARVPERVEAGLDTAMRALREADPDLRFPEELRVLITLGDPTDDHFMHEIQGLSAFGGIAGFIELTLWPNPTVLERVEAIAAHELHHNVRYGPGGIVWNPMTVAVGEQVVAEGLADVFARELYGEAGPTHFVGAAGSSEDAVAKVLSGLEITGMQHMVPWVHGDAAARRFGAEPVGLPTGAGYAAGRVLVDGHLTATRTTAAANVRTDWRIVAGTSR
ncbi:MAG: DUF2268 domain-containing putative Zn-dependent protease [Arachnia propionica]|uniref:DUF2268 domain-containing protein n=1 Tax=Arachnia propionica TaxID=1750 RepID=UPI0026F59162|nr:DUF2268 domain-containing putative Zn-dependent protease [Arachnia propionica]